MRDCISINMILDRSSSMASIRQETIDTVNTYIKEQQNSQIPVEVSLYQFDHEYAVSFENQPINKFEPLNLDTFLPRGSTALLDAIGNTIDNKGRYFASLPENQRPNKVLFVIMTDGEENSSVTFSYHDIVDKIKRQTNEYSWDFVFLGANQDAIASAANLGINATKALTYNTNAPSLRNVSSSLNKYTQRFAASNNGVAETQFLDTERESVRQ